MRNQSAIEEISWVEGEYRFHEVIRQEYSNCVFSAGLVEGHPVDTMYLRLEKNGVVTTDLLLRPDEMAAIAWLASGSLWTEAMARQTPDQAATTQAKA